MKFPIVSRKKYEIAQSNFRLCNEQRQKNDEMCSLYQKKIIDLQCENTNLKKENATLKGKITKLNKKLGE